MAGPSVVLATAGYDHTLRFWEATSGICYRTLPYQDSQVGVYGQRISVVLLLCSDQGLPVFARGLVCSRLLFGVVYTHTRGCRVANVLQ